MNGIRTSSNLFDLKSEKGQSYMIQHKLLHDLSDEEFFVMKWPMLILHQKGMGEDGSHLG